jgi:hypothetical protein
VEAAAEEPDSGVGLAEEDRWILARKWRESGERRCVKPTMVKYWQKSMSIGRILVGGEKERRVESIFAYRDANYTSWCKKNGPFFASTSSPRVFFCSKVM